MKYKKLDMGAYQLHLVQTDRFKTILTRVCLRDKIIKEEITLRNFLTGFLTYSTATYKTKREVVLKAQDLYAANVYTKTYRAGNYNMISFYLSILNEKYTEEGMTEKSFELLSDMLFNPNFEEGKEFDEAFNYLRNSAETGIKGIKEEPTLYSTVRMMDCLGEENPYSFHEHGYLEDLEKIDRNSLMEYYQKIMNKSLVDIYIIGDFEEQIMIEYVKKYMKFDTFKRPKESQIIYHDKLPKRSKIKKEKIEGAQSKLSIGCKIDTLNEFERNYVLTIYNFLLGSGSESKFFRIIREKHSLAYYIYSSLNKLDHLMIIRAGISKENFDQTIKLIKELLKEMENGKFSEEEVETAKNNYITFLKEIEDSESAIIETYLAKDLLNLGDIEERKREVQKVTKEDIMAIAKKVKIDTIFLLEGEVEDEGN